MFCAIDTDILLYRAASSAETEIDWGDDIWSLFTDLKNAKEAFQHQIDVITGKLGVSDYVCCLSDHGSNFRRSLTPPTNPIAKAHASQLAMSRCVIGSRKISGHSDDQGRS